MGYWVRFSKTNTNIPDGYSGSWFEGSEWIEDVTSNQLDSCYRNAKGKWIERGPEPEYNPSPEDIAAQADAEYQAAVEAVEAARRAAYQQEADSLFFKWQAGEATKEEWLSSREKVRLDYPLPDRPEGI